MREPEMHKALEDLMASYPEEQRGEAAMQLFRDALEDYIVLVGRDEALEYAYSIADALARGEFDAGS